MMDAGVFVVMDEVQHYDTDVIAALTAHAQAVHQRNPSAGPVLGVNYNFAEVAAKPELSWVDAATANEATSTVEMRRPFFDHITEAMLASHNFTRYESLSEILVTLNCCVYTQGDFDAPATRMTCGDEVGATSSHRLLIVFSRFSHLLHSFLSHFS